MRFTGRVLTGHVLYRPGTAPAAVSRVYHKNKDPALRAGPSLRIIYFPVWDLI